MYLHIFYTGGRDKKWGKYAEILKYSHEGKWTRIGKMTQARVFHGIAVIDFDHFKTYCQ